MRLRPQTTSILRYLTRRRFSTGHLKVLTAEQRATFQADGYVRVPNVFSAKEMQEIGAWINDIEELDDSSDEKWMHHYERTQDGTIRLARTEHFLGYHAGLARLLMDSRVSHAVADAAGEPVFLFKEKINYKAPGGAGFRAHQDAPAYAQTDAHITCLLSIEDSDVTNGCLEFAAGEHLRGLVGLNAETGTIDPNVEDTLTFEPCETQAGDLVLFTSYAPHRSGANVSRKSRKLLYLTYNTQAQGYLRDEYYRDKRARLQAGSISTIQHFKGVDIGPPPPSPESTVGIGPAAIAELKYLFESVGSSQYDPAVTQEEHALQTATLAERAGASDEMVVAAFLHDVGHLILDEHAGNDDFLSKDESHESHGAQYLSSAFPKSVTEPIRMHVPAKRYLCATDKEYWNGLSDASKRSLDVQGGPFSESEAEAFISQPFAKEAVQLRLWDDMAKTAGVETNGRDYFLDGPTTRLVGEV